MGDKSKYLTVRLDDEMEKALEQRMDYLQQLWGVRRVTKSDAVRHALLKSNYSRKKSDRSGDDLD